MEIPICLNCPDVPAVEPDIRGASTIRELLEKHRQVSSCAECHRKIDPLGFALENFDAVGAWRNQYDGKLPIDSSGTMPDGRQFGNISEFRGLLHARRDEFNRCLTEKLMAYALGRKLDINDRPAIDEILSTLKMEQGGLQDLIRLIVLSDPFLNN